MKKFLSILLVVALLFMAMPANVFYLPAFASNVMDEETNADDGNWTDGTVPTRGSTTTLFPAGTTPTAPAPTDPEEGPLFANFTSEARYNLAISESRITLGNSVNATLTYDEAGAAKVTYTNGSGNTGRLGESAVIIAPSINIPVAGNEVVVAKVKVVTTITNDTGFLTYGNHVQAGGVRVTSPGNGNVTYKIGDSGILDAGNGWVYVAYTDAAQVEALGVPTGSTWGNFSFQAHGSYFNVNDTISIAWVGAFISLAAAKAWDATGAATSTAPTTTTTKKTTTTTKATTTTTSTTTTTTTSTTQPTVPADPFGRAGTFFLDFTTVDDYNLYTGWGDWRLSGEGTAYENTSAAATPREHGLMYDTEIGALKLVKKAGYTGSNFGFSFAGRVAGIAGDNYDDYPILALKVKMSSKAKPGQIVYRKEDGAWAYGKNTGTPAAYTGEWQLILINAVDYATNNPTVNGWKGINAIIGTNATAFEEGETYGYVAWAGAFKTAADAEAYYLSNTEVTNPLIADFRTEEQYDTAVETGKLALTGDPANGTLSYGDGALKVTYLNGKPVTAGSRRGETGINIYANNQVLVSAGKIVVAKVKANTYGHADGFLGYGDKVWAGSTQIGSGAVVGNGNHPYATKFDWAMDAGNGWTYVAYNTEASVADVAAAGGRLYD